MKIWGGPTPSCRGHWDLADERLWAYAYPSWCGLAVLSPDRALYVELADCAADSVEVGIRFASK